MHGFGAMVHPHDTGVYTLVSHTILRIPPSMSMSMTMASRGFLRSLCARGTTQHLPWFGHAHAHTHTHMQPSSTTGLPYIQAGTHWAHDLPFRFGGRAFNSCAYSLCRVLSRHYSTPPPQVQQCLIAYWRNISMTQEYFITIYTFQGLNYFVKYPISPG